MPFCLTSSSLCIQESQVRRQSRICIGDPYSVHFNMHSMNYKDEVYIHGPTYWNCSSQLITMEGVLLGIMVSINSFPFWVLKWSPKWKRNRFHPGLPPNQGTAALKTIPQETTQLRIRTMFLTTFPKHLVFRQRNIKALGSLLISSEAVGRNPLCSTFPVFHEKNRVHSTSSKDFVVWAVSGIFTIPNSSGWGLSNISHKDTQ